MNDSNAEFIASEEIKITVNAKNAIILTSEPTVDVIDEGITHNKELQTNKMSKKSEENSLITWKRNVSLHSGENCFPEDRVWPTNLAKVFQLLIFMNKVILMSWLNYLFNKATSVYDKMKGAFSPVPRKFQLLLVSVTS